MQSTWPSVAIALGYLAASVACLYMNYPAAGSVALIASFLFGCTAVARAKK